MIGSGLAMLPSNLRQNRIGKEMMQSLIKGRPRFWHNIIFAHGVYIKLLLKKGVQLYLIEHGFYLKGFTDVSQYMRITVGHADGF